MVIWLSFSDLKREMTTMTTIISTILTFAFMITFCINQTSADPYFNLAAEEYFLKNFQEDFFMLWRSRPSVVVGKHQNALAEINHDFVRTHQIPVARRLSGGGTVFHDPGNINFTFIRNVEKIQEVNFKVFTSPILEALKKLGVEAYTSGRNDLLIDGKKISGNAEHVYRKRVLHHGTLLYSSQLDALKGTLKVDLSKFEDKAVQSNRSEVANIATYLNEPISVEDFGNLLFLEICNQIDGFQDYVSTETDLVAIQKLSDEKYRTWDWIFGYSPKYRFKNQFSTPKGEISIELLVEKGILVEVSVLGAIAPELSQKIAEVLIGCRHDSDALKSQIFKLETIIKAEEIDSQSFIKAMF